MKHNCVYVLGVLALMTSFVTRGSAENEAPPATAEEAVKAMVTSAMKQDIEAAKAFMDKDWIADCDFMFQKKGGVKGFWGKITKNFTAQTLETGKSEIRQDVTRVPVTLTFADKTTMASTFRCKKLNDRWIVLGN